MIIIVIIIPEKALSGPIKGIFWGSDPKSRILWSTRCFHSSGLKNQSRNFQEPPMVYGWIDAWNVVLSLAIL